MVTASSLHVCYTALYHYSIMTLIIGKYTKQQISHSLPTMKFPWTTENTNARVDLLKPEMLEAIELHNAMSRAQEELLILKAEKQKLLQYLGRSHFNQTLNVSINCI